MRQNFASFRDASGAVYETGAEILRTVNKCYAEDWEHVKNSGLLQKAMDKGLLAVREVPIPTGLAGANVYAVLCAEKLPFLSWPHEWSFSQLQDAALLTLEMQKLALEHGCILKDASAYNIQFFKGKPVFIDTLSFEKWDQHSPWEAYRQFCSHFLAPLALEAYLDRRCGLLAANWIDGIPLDLACAMLPFKARLSLGLNLHLFMHSAMQKRYGDARKSAEKARKVAIGRQKMLDLGESLENTVRALAPAGKETEWGAYYGETNYSEQGMRNKEELVSSVAKRYAKVDAHGLAIDLGANDGHFSALLQNDYDLVVAADMDPAAVDAHYKKIRNETSSPMLPLVLDLTNPTPAIGWANQERASFMRRAKADFVLALALCHHLHFSGGIPFSMIADFFSQLIKAGGGLLVEFVPAEDSQVKRLLAARNVRLDDYTLANFCQAFANAGFRQVAQHRVAESCRTLIECVREAR